MTGWFINILRDLAFWIDELVYGLIEIIYNFLMYISSIHLSDDVIKSFADRIYVFAGIFMLFRLAFSFITYLTNPDALSDKQSGGSKIVLNVLISLGLVVFVPLIFDLAYEAQDMILSENILGKIILGENSNSATAKSSAGKTMAFTTFTAFFRIEDEACEIPYSNGSLVLGCKNYIGDEDVANVYETAYKTASMSLLYEIDNIEKDDKYLFRYDAIISTVAGGFIVVILIGFCIDVALRIIKLSFLQLIAPIPILSYIDPKSGKDGLFKKWYKMCFSTYVSLFVRLAAIYFAVYVISLAVNSDNWVSEDGKISGLTMVVIIIGSLMFAKQLPDMLKELFPGFSGDGKFTLNPFKKLTDSMVGGQFLASRTKALAGGVDAKLHGKRFREGWNNSLGDTGLRKFRKEWLPYRNTAVEGKDEIKDTVRTYEKGEKIAKDFYKEFGHSKPENEDEYKYLYKTFGPKGEEFAKSAFRVTRAKNGVEKAEKNLEYARAALNEAYSSDEKDINKKQQMIDAAQADYSNKKDDYDKANKELETAQKTHDSLRKKHQDAAQVEDEFKAYGHRDLEGGRTSHNPHPTKGDGNQTTPFQPVNETGIGGNTQSTQSDHNPLPGTRTQTNSDS